MNQLERLRAMSPGDAISAIAADLASGGSTYASVEASEIIKACGVGVAEGSLGIVWGAEHGVRPYLLSAEPKLA